MDNPPDKVMPTDSISLYFGFAYDVVNGHLYHIVIGKIGLVYGLFGIVAVYRHPVYMRGNGKRSPSASGNSSLSMPNTNTLTPKAPPLR